MAKKPAKRKRSAAHAADDATISVTRGLNARQLAFLREYLVCRNATQAAIKAGYSEDTAAEQGSRLLRNVQIREAIRAEDERSLEAVRVTRDAIVAELARVGFADPRKLMDWGPGGVILKPSADLSAEEAAAVAEASQTITKDGGAVRLKLHNKVAALTELAKIAGLYPKDRVIIPEVEDEDAGQSHGVLVLPAKAPLPPKEEA